MQRSIAKNPINSLMWDLKSYLIQKKAEKEEHGGKAETEKMYRKQTEFQP